MLTRRSLLPIAIFTAVALFLVGGVGAWIAVRLAFPYSYLTPVALLVYGAAGFYGCRAGAAGWLAGAIVAGIDALAWATFGGVGPQPTVSNAEIGAKLFAALFSLGLGAVAGFVGGRMARRQSPPSPSAVA